VRHVLVAGLLAMAAACAPGGCRHSEAQPAAEDRLVIYSPHADEIREEFGAAFEAWYLEQTGRTVDVQWPDAGGTSQMVRRLQDKSEAGRFDVDIVFGGGSKIYDDLRQLGLLEPYRLPEPLLKEIPPVVAGERMYDPGFSWYGAALSTFGLIYNKKVVRERGLPPIENWEAMAAPEYFGLVGPGDPSKSGSVRTAYAIILEAYGYEKGLALLVRMGANAREFYPGAGDIPRMCAQGFIAVGPCIDFYADRQRHSEGGEAIGFVAPKGLTILNADPIAILQKAPHRAVAEKFVEFVMSPAGQGLWMLPAGAPGGPRKFSLERMAVLPSIFELPAVKARGVETNPFTLPPAPFSTARKASAPIGVMTDYLRVAIVESQPRLQRAWKAILDAGMPPDLVQELVVPAATVEEMIVLGKEVWRPIVVPAGASPEEADQLQRQEEMRLRRKFETELGWQKTLRARYEDLTARAAARK
jgi:iron(III) transport system substrate-binding protein